MLSMDDNLEDDLCNLNCNNSYELDAYYYLQ